MKFNIKQNSVFSVCELFVLAWLGTIVVLDFIQPVLSPNFFIWVESAQVGMTVFKVVLIIRTVFFLGIYMLFALLSKVNVPAFKDLTTLTDTSKPHNSPLIVARHVLMVVVSLYVFVKPMDWLEGHQLSRLALPICYILVILATQATTNSLKSVLSKVQQMQLEQDQISSVP